MKEKPRNTRFEGAFSSDDLRGCGKRRSTAGQSFSWSVCASVTGVATILYGLCLVRYPGGSLVADCVCPWNWGAGGCGSTVVLTEQVYYSWNAISSCIRWRDSHNSHNHLHVQWGEGPWGGPFSPEDLSWTRERVLGAGTVEAPARDQLRVMLSLAGAESFTVPQMVKVGFTGMGWRCCVRSDRSSVVSVGD